ncbi:efflux transporter outer membrane subunit [Desulforhopalus vacuolatus]|uniref:efflux transporter outer membrane subunit n=1 Tax=Desulforhopalus vacuolatus TaxID=40414 RepID=UPI0019652493|nr:efflux transporter outer membrane subunit [Desulforhopalus vacuolatus]MBM9518446.1 efflux transporter outer membrane subunit [Desulforhopalus vacuolatus]
MTVTKKMGERLIIQGSLMAMLTYNRFPRFFSLLFALLCSSLLSGCFRAQSRPATPFEIPQNFSSSGAEEASARWWESFGDKELNSLVERALHDNFSLRAAGERVSELEALARIAGAPLIPSLDGTGSASSERSFKSDTTSDTFSLGVTSSWEIDLWGRLRANHRAAGASLAAGEEDFNNAALSIAAEVADTWFARRENAGQQSLLSQQQNTNRKSLKIIDIKVITGQTGIADLLQQQQLVESNTTSLEVLGASASILDHRIAILLGKPPAPLKMVVGNLPELPPLPAAGLPLELVQRRPDIRAAFHSLESADAYAAAAVANRFPQLSVSGSLVTGGTSTHQLFNTWLGTLGASLTAPIFDGGSRRAEVDRRVAAAKQKFYTWGQTVLEALNEVENALNNEKALLKQLFSLEKQLKLASDSVEQINRRYRQGTLGYQRVLSTTLTVQNLQRDILSIKYQLLSNRIALYRALSGGLPGELLPPESKEAAPVITSFF